MREHKTEIKQMFREFLPLMIAVAFQSIVALTVNLIDNFMLGGYSEAAMSGASLVNQVQFILSQLVSSVGMGVAIIGAQYWGKNNVGPIRSIIAIGLRFSLVAGVLFCAVTVLFPAQILALFTNEPSAAAEGVRYLQIMCWTYLVYSISGVFLYSLQAVQTAFIGVVMSCCTIVINASLNYCLIYGNFGCPELGVQGAGYATLASRCVELIVICVYIFAIDKKIGLKPSHLLKYDSSYLKTFAVTAAPIIIAGVLWGVAQAVQSGILGHMGATALAANSIAAVVFALFNAIGMACNNGASVIIGKTIGEGRLDLIKPFSKALQLFFVCLGVCVGLLLFVIKDLVVGLYGVSAETAAMTLQFLTVLSISIIGTCYQCPCAYGIVAGGGDTRYGAVVDNLFMWLWTIPAACISAFVLNMPPLVTFILLKSDQILKCVPNSIKTNRYKWVHIFTK